MKRYRESFNHAWHTRSGVSILVAAIVAAGLCAVALAIDWITWGEAITVWIVAGFGAVIWPRVFSVERRRR